MNNLKGYEFENEVRVVLCDLEKKFPEWVKVRSQRDFRTALRPHRADFELEYNLGGLTHQHLIECQNRKRSSFDVADKIYAVRGTSDRNRYMFVYKNQHYLSIAVERRLRNMGVLCFRFDEFKNGFIVQLEADLGLRGLGLIVLQNPILKLVVEQIIKTGKGPKSEKELRTRRLS